MRCFAASLILALLCGCGGWSEPVTGDLRLVVDARARSDLPPEALLHSTMDWSRLPMIKAELMCMKAVERTPRVHVVEIRGNGPRPSGVVAREGDSVRVVNVSHRLMHVLAWSSDKPAQPLPHGAILDFPVSDSPESDVISDEAASFQLRVDQSRGSEGRFVTAHHNEWFKGLLPGSWELWLSHERIPLLKVPFEIREGQTTRLFVPFEVGRLPPLQK